MIKIKFSKTNPHQPTKITVEASGYVGPMCAQATGLIRAALGVQLSEEKKPEFDMLQTEGQAEADHG